MTISLADPAKQSSLIDSVGKIFKEADINGAPPLPLVDQVNNSVVTATLSDRPVRIEAGAEFAATLQVLPQYARVQILVSGAPVGTSIQIKLNGGVVGEISMEVPDLNDPGYQSTDGGDPIYVGWRKGVIYLPASVLKIGENQFQIGLKDVVPSGTASPLAVKDFLLQLKYPEPVARAPSEGVEKPVETPQPAPAISGT